MRVILRGGLRPFTGLWGILGRGAGRRGRGRRDCDGETGRLLRVEQEVSRPRQPGRRLAAESRWAHWWYSPYRSYLLCRSNRQRGPVADRPVADPPVGDPSVVGQTPYSVRSGGRRPGLAILEGRPVRGTSV